MKKENDLIKSRSEILFLYDITDANPNGDPDENKPRIDEDTQINYVTDVRLKRTIRDYLSDYKQLDIFVSRREEETITASRRFREALERMEKFDMNNFLLSFIDIRLFGCTITIQKEDKNVVKEKKYNKGSLTLTGPVQFNIGRSLHAVEVNEIKGTAAFASIERKHAGTFTVQYVLPYSLIGFYGVINENAARYTNLTEEDVLLLLDAIWNGTKNLITRSKFPQIPRFLLKIDYKEDNYHIGELHKKIKLIKKNKKEDKAIRTTDDYELDLFELKKIIESNKDKIKKIDYLIDGDLKIKNGKLTEIFDFNEILLKKLEL